MTAMLEARPVFDELLARYGFRLAVEHVEHESFGSSYAEYVRRGMRVRLIWDGKESVLSVVVARVSEQRLIGDWADLESMISGRPVSVAEAEAPDRVTRLRERTEQFLAFVRGESGGIRPNRKDAVRQPPNRTLDVAARSVTGRARQKARPAPVRLSRQRDR